MALNIDVNEIREGLKVNGSFEKNYGPLTEDEVQKAISILAGARDTGFNCQIRQYEKDGKTYVGFVLSKAPINFSIDTTAANSSPLTEEEKAEIDEHTRNAQAIIDADKRRKAERQASAMSDDNSGLRRGK